ncbi:glycosyltransferase family 4 protein [Nocardioides marmoraquaticus]
MSRTVVAVVSAYTVPDIGGVEAYGARVARALRDSDRYTPVIVAASPDRRDHHLEVDGVPVHRLGSRGRVSNTPVNPDWWWRLRGLLDDLDVGLVNVHAPVPGLPDAAQWASRRRRPVVTTFHSGDMLKGEHHGIDLALRMYQSLWLPSMFRRSDAVISSSSVALSHRWRGEDTIVSPGVDVEQFRPLGLERDASLLYVGRLERSSAWKGVHVLVDAVPEVLRARPDARLRLAGHGDAVPDLQERARRLGVADHVDFLGPKSHAELVEVYNRAGALVLPSLTEAESFGMTLVEAMACETPVVGSTIGGIPTVVRDGVDGLLATPGDAASLAAACTRVLTDPALAARLGAAGRAAAVDRWAWDNAMATTLAVFDGVLAARGAVPRRTRFVARA